jgi:DNA-binding response OmpR family regulator
VPHRILLVEADITLRNELGTALSGRGHAVLEADSVPRALDVLGIDARGVDLIVCDCDTAMPGLPGIELLRAAHACRPALPLVGLIRSHAEVVAHPTLAGVRWLAKPIALDQLFAAVAALIEPAFMSHPAAGREHVSTAYRIAPHRALVYSWAWGELSDADLARHYATLAADPAFRPTFRHLGDLREVTRVPASAETIAGIARSDPFAPAAVRAVAAPATEAFGLSRMFAAYAEAEGKQIGIFRNMAAAEAWLDLPPGTADALRRSA